MEGAGFLCLGLGKLDAMDGKLCRDGCIDDVLHPFLFLISHLCGVHEVESKSLGSDVRSLLLDMGAEDLAEGLMQKVRSGVIFKRDFRRVAETALELLLCASAREVLMLLELLVERCTINSNPLRLCELDGEVDRKSIAREKSESVNTCKRRAFDGLAGESLELLNTVLQSSRELV